MAETNEENTSPEVDEAAETETQTEIPGVEAESNADEVDSSKALAELKAKYEAELKAARADAEKTAAKKIAAERKKLAEEQKVAAERAKMDELERFKAEKEDAEKSLAEAKAEAQSHQKKLELYRAMSASKATAAAETAVPMIEAAFAAALEESGGDPAKALEAIHGSHHFLFAKAEAETPPKPKTAKPKTGPTTTTGADPAPKIEKPPKGLGWDKTIAWYNAQKQSASH